MLTFRAVQRFIILLTLVSLTGCGFFGSSNAPTAEEAQVVDSSTAVEAEGEAADESTRAEGRIWTVPRKFVRRS